MYNVVHFVLRNLMPRYFHWQSTGVEHLPAEGPAIVVSNHVNYLDPMAMGAVSSRPLHFMAKEELFANAFGGWFLRNVDAFPVRRGQSDRRAIRHALRILAEGHLLAMFPEGTRSRTGELQELQRGAALLALKSGAPVVPMVVTGAYEALSGGRKMPRRVPMAVHIGEPLRLGQPSRVDQAAVTAASDRIHAAIEALYSHTEETAGQADARTVSDSVNNGFERRKRYRSRQKNV